MDPYVERVSAPAPDMAVWMARIDAHGGYTPLGIYVMLSMNVDPDWFEENEPAIAASPCYRHIREEFTRRMNKMIGLIEDGKLHAIRIER